jgi:hypothetical protein
MDSIATHYAAKRTRMDPPVAEADVHITNVPQSQGWMGPDQSGSAPTPAPKVKTEAQKAEARRRMKLAKARRKSGAAPRRSSCMYFDHRRKTLILAHTGCGKKVNLRHQPVTWPLGFFERRPNPCDRSDPPRRAQPPLLRMRNQPSRRRGRRAASNLGHNLNLNRNLAWLRIPRPGLAFLGRQHPH